MRRDGGFLKLFRAVEGNLMMPGRTPRDVSSEHRFREGRCDGETFVQLPYTFDPGFYSREGVTSQVSVSHTARFYDVRDTAKPSIPSQHAITYPIYPPRTLDYRTPLWYFSSADLSTRVLSNLHSALSPHREVTCHHPPPLSSLPNTVPAST